MKVKNDFAPHLNNRGKYNPNGYAKYDAGIVFLSFTLLFYLASLLFVWVVKSIPTVYKAFKEDYWLLSCVSIVYSQLIIFAFAFVYSKIRKVSLFNGGGYACKFSMVPVLMGILLICGVYFVFSSAHMQIASDFSELFPSSGINVEDYPVNGWTLLDAFVLSVILPAICEEALMRSIVMRSLENFGSLFAIICSGAMFAIFHGNTSQLLLQFLGGVAIAFALISTKNFFVSCAMHGMYNLFVYVLAIFEGLLEENHYKAFLFYDAVTVFVGICFIAVAVYYFVKLYISKEKRDIKVNRDIPLSKKVYIYDKERTIKEVYAYKTQEVNQELEAGKLFLHGKNFISANKKGNNIFSIIILSVSIVVGVVFVFI